MVALNGTNQKVEAHFPNAQAVYLIGSFNNWCTTATPMHRRDDGVWETELPMPADPHAMRFFVWRPGQVGGRLYRHDLVAS